MLGRVAQLLSGAGWGTEGVSNVVTLRVHGIGQERAGEGVCELKGETRVEACWMGWGCTGSMMREETLPAHHNELFLLFSQVQHGPADEDGIRHEVPQPSPPQVPVQVRKVKGGRERELPVCCRAELRKFQCHTIH